MLVCGVAAAGMPENNDVRVLIDISGSMQQNDPQNLRRPALRMLSGLLQPGTRAGVWTFARWVNNLVPVAEVDRAWKARTRSLSEQIGSPGQFTNIEEVLDQASRDWSGEPTSHARHLLLLTDGMVDVSKDPGENRQSRARILDVLLPRLKAAGVKVHTIALSDRADHELMRQLAHETGGWYQQVAEADELQRVFLRMFETVGRPESVPLDDNRFVVDGSISEVTVLVFTRPGAEPVVLRAPSGETFTDSDLPAGVAWFRDRGYALITISAPQKGEWSLDADIDPDNRVMIVTDLKLQTSEVPAHLAAGESVTLEAFLTNRGEVVDRQAFLRLLEVRADALTGEGREALALNDAGDGGDERAADGRYTLRYGAAHGLEEVELLVAVDSPTFMREKRLRLAVHEPAQGLVEEGPEGLQLVLQIESAVMQEGARVDAWQETAGGQRLPLQPVEVAPGRWQAELADAQAAAYARVVGDSLLGRPVERVVGPLLPPGVAAPAEPAPQEQVEPPAAVAPVADAVPDAAPVAADIPAETQGWLMPSLLFAGFNLMLLVAGVTWWLVRRRRAAVAAAEDGQGLEALLEQTPAIPRRDDAADLREDAA